MEWVLSFLIRGTDRVNEKVSFPKRSNWSSKAVTNAADGSRCWVHLRSEAPTKRSASVDATVQWKKSIVRCQRWTVVSEEGSIAMGDNGILMPSNQLPKRKACGECHALSQRGCSPYFCYVHFRDSRSTQPKVCFASQFISSNGTIRQGQAELRK